MCEIRRSDASWIHRFGSDESLPTGFILNTCPACFIADLDRIGHQLRQHTGHRVSLCDRKLGIQLLRNSLLEHWVLSHARNLPTAVKASWLGYRMGFLIKSGKQTTTKNKKKVVFHCSRLPVARGCVIVLLVVRVSKCVPYTNVVLSFVIYPTCHIQYIIEPRGK
jgi:hypothetical protein